MTEKELYIPTEGNRPSLHQLAIVLGLPVVRLQSAQVAYKPQEGKPYDPKAINWEAVSAFIERRLDKTGYDSVEEVYAAAMETEYTPKKATHTAKEGSVWGKFLFGTTPLRKGNVVVGSRIKSRKTGVTGTVDFVNDTIVVYTPDAAEGEKVVSSSIGNRLFNMHWDIIDENAAENAAE